MNKHTIDTMTTAALRDLDPAPTAALSQSELDRADATFGRIVSTPHQDHVPEVRGRPRRRRLLVLGGLVGTAAVAVPALLLGGGSAFASWTSKPETLAAADAAEAAATCRGRFPPPGEGTRVVSAERRGEFTYVLIVGPHYEAACLMHDDLVEKFDEAYRRSGFLGSYSPDPVEAPTLARDSIDETESAQGSISIRGRLPFTTDEGWLSWVNGYVGSDVIGVTVHPPVGPDVEASVANGRFAAWWPSAPPSSKNLEVMGAPTYTVTLADGSTRRVTG